MTHKNLPADARILLEEAARLLDSDSFHKWKGAAFRISQYLAGVPLAPYGYCPICSAPGMARDGVDGPVRCQKGHRYSLNLARPAPEVEDFVHAGAAEDYIEAVGRA